MGKEAVRTGLNIMSDVTTHNTPVKESFRNRVRESGEILKRKAEEKLDKLMEGSGYKMPRYGNPAQLQMLAAPITVHSRKKSRKRGAFGRVKKRVVRKTTNKKKKKKGKIPKRKGGGGAKKKRKGTKRRTVRTVRDIFDS